jgi:K+-sensing histidine kinase KdpD
MQPQLGSALARYGAAVAIILLAALVRYWFDRVLEGGGFALFLAAVVIAAWYGGLGPSLVALGLSIAISIAFFGRRRTLTPIR